MKKSDYFSFCQNCFDSISEKSQDTLLLYLDICIRHFEGHLTYIYFEEDGFELEDLNFLERKGYVISADSNSPDLIMIMPRMREDVNEIKYCCEKSKHFD